ncbi:MAG: SH3 domain-containing protein [Pseudomonadota bacterium]
MTMRRTIRYVLAAAAMLVASAATADAACTRNLDRNDNLNIRPTPSVKFRPIGQIRGGSCDINVIGCRDGWCQITDRGVRGFVSGFYLREDRSRGWDDDDVARELRRRKADQVVEAMQANPRWRRLGVIDVERGRSRYFIQMDRDDGTYDTLRLNLTGGPLELNRVGVVYGNDKRDTLAVERRLARNAVTPAYDLAGSSGRNLDRIELDFQTIPGRGRIGQLEVWAKTAAKTAAKTGGQTASAPAPNAPDAFGPNWVKLGEKVVSRNTDRDVITLSRQDGRFSALGIIARRNDIRVYDISVRYGNGDIDRLLGDERLRRGQRSRALDLEGNSARFVTGVGFTYETITPGPPAIVELWGRPR